MKIEIFRVGKHTSSNGTTKDYTLDHLNQIVQNHSEPTPIVVGHPKDNSPAFGWIKNLFVKGESLFAEATDLVPEFLDLLKQKIYKNRSVSLKTNADGELFLNHVAFLGGALPAVKGLEELNLSADDSESFEMEFSEIELDGIELKSNTPSKKKKASSKREETNFSEAITSLQNEMIKLTKFVGTLKDSDSTDLSEMQTKIDELNIKLDAAHFQRSIHDKLDFSSLTPAIKTKLETLLGFFESFDFSETDQTKIFSDFQELADLIQPFQTDEVLKKVEFEKKTKDSVNEFSEMNVDKDSLKLFNEATHYSKENEVTFHEAVNILINKQNEAI